MNDILEGLSLSNFRQKPDKDEVRLFGKRYKWVREGGKLSLVPLPTSPVTLGSWECCGRLKIL